MNPYIYAAYSQSYPPHTEEVQGGGGGGNILVGAVVKAKVCELEEEIREGFSRRLPNSMGNQPL